MQCCGWSSRMYYSLFRSAFKGGVSKMNKKNSPQRKTTLKWNSNGELSEIDMLRILERLSSNDLNQCELTCDSDQL